MPGYMMHLCESRVILDKLNISPDAQRTPSDCFILGSVIPDAASDKALTHFRPKWQTELITKYPDEQNVIDTFLASDKTPADCGILAHLLMDCRYVRDFWPLYFRFEDEYGTETAVTSDIRYVRMTERSMQPAGSRIDFCDFFSGQYFYGDYDATNPLFQSEFRPVIPPVYDCPVSMTDYTPEMQLRLQADLDAFAGGCASSGCATPGNPNHASTNIFPYADLKEFICGCAQDYVNRFAGFM